MQSTIMLATLKRLDGTPLYICVVSPLFLQNLHSRPGIVGGGEGDEVTDPEPGKERYATEVIPGGGPL